MEEMFESKSQWRKKKISRIEENFADNESLDAPKNAKNIGTVKSVASSKPSGYQNYKTASTSKRN